MKLLPAIDLASGRCVRLCQGRFEKETVYSEDPCAAAAAFAEEGAEEIHMVDLDGARAGAPVQHETFQRVAASTSAKLQVAGGFRCSDHVETALKRGAHRVILGSMAMAQPDLVEGLIESFGPDRIGVALDITLNEGIPTVATHGWRKHSDKSLIDAISQFPSVEHVLVTDISRDGMLGGPNIFLMAMLAKQFPHVAFQASGGVSSLTDISALKRTRAARAIVGKAIWEGRFGVAEALLYARG